MNGHKWEKISRKISYPYCKKCGLVHLRNDISRRLAKRPCSVGDNDYKIIIPGLSEYVERN